jgi:hypothetical protein
MMTTKKSARFTKPGLEVLEGRSLPSFLLSGAVNQLAQPLNNMVTDLSAAKTALTTSQTALFNEQFNQDSVATVAQNFAHASAAYQRMLNDVHSIAAVSTADLAFINMAAQYEFQHGDPMDLLVLQFGPQFGINVTTPLTTPVGQANTTLQSVQSIVNQTYQHVGPSVPVNVTFNLPSIASQTTTPSF